LLLGWILAGISGGWLFNFRSGADCVLLNINAAADWRH